MLLFPIVILLILLMLSLEKNMVGVNNTGERKQQLAVRGIFAVYIIFSHMYRNSNVFDNSIGSTIISIISPSLLCLFFFYSGYGAMYKYERNGSTSFREALISWVKKLITPAVLAFVVAYVLEYTVSGSVKPLSVSTILNELGGWFLKTMLVLQAVFWICSKFATKIQYFIIGLLVSTIMVIVAMRIVGLQSYYYIDCFAFVFGAISCAYPKAWNKLVTSKSVVVFSGLFTIFMGGIPILLQHGILPSRMGIGLIVGFINSITQVILYQSLIAYFKFKSDNIFEKLGKYSYEIYLSGPCAFVLAINMASNDFTYYLIYTVFCIGIGVGLNKIVSSFK